MRYVVAAALSLALAAGGTAMAAPYSSWHRGDAPPPPPKAWAKRGHERWERHVDACSARYHSYNPRTDTFVARHGKRIRCRL